jgi:hypothetical protein
MLLMAAKADDVECAKYAIIEMGGTVKRYDPKDCWANLDQLPFHWQLSFLRAMLVMPATVSLTHRSGNFTVCEVKDWKQVARDFCPEQYQSS